MTSPLQMVWIHGWGAGPAVWRDLLGAFPMARHRLPSFAAVGCADDLLPAVMREVEPGPCLAVGWSLGATLALEAALRHPERFLGLVLFAASARFVSHNPVLGWEAEVLRRMAKRVERRPATVLKGFHHAMFGPEDRRRRRAAAFAAAMHGDDPLAACGFTRAGLQAGLAHLMRLDLRPELGQLAVPTLWIHGGEDAICPLGGVHRAVGMLPAGEHELLVWDEAGHCPFWSRPAAAEAAVRAFCKHLPAAPPCPG